MRVKYNNERNKELNAFFLLKGSIEFDVVKQEWKKNLKFLNLKHKLKKVVNISSYGITIDKAHGKNISVV